MKSSLLLVFGVFQLCKGQADSFGNDRRLINRRPLNQQSPCSGGNYFDPVDEDGEGRKFFLAAGAAIGGAALGYHLGMKHQNQNPVIINNNIHNDYPSPCIAVQSGGGGIGGGLGGGILGNHPILSSILQGGLWNGGGGGGGNRIPPNRISSGRQPNSVNWNRAIRQFSRVVRPITRGFR